MTSERILLRFFDVGDFFIDFNGGIKGLEGVSEDRIESIASIGTSKTLERNRGSVSILALVITMSAYQNAREMHVLHVDSRNTYAVREFASAVSVCTLY